MALFSFLLLFLLIKTDCLDLEEAKEAVREASRSLDRDRASRGPSSGRGSRAIPKALLAHAAFAPPSQTNLDIQQKSRALLGASASLAKRGRGGVEALAPFDADEEFQRFLPDILPGRRCVSNSVKCDLSSRYRTVSGHCNNVQHPEYGAANSPYRRLRQAAYDDELDAPRRRSSDGEELPSARKVSVGVHETSNRQDRNHSHLLMQWGQFLDHDITLTPQSRSSYDGSIVFCDCEQQSSGRERFRRSRPSFQFTADCFPIPVPPEDPIFNTTKCISFVRSQAGQLKLGPREQLNQITSYIDASNVYGSDEFTASQLRSKEVGQLKLEESGALPRKHEPACSHQGQAHCFQAGDVRCNVQLGLMSMHTLWAHHHNALAKELKRLNPHWDDEKLYQETRRVVIAQHQHITYNEFLPKVLGPEYMEKYGLRPRTGGRFYEDYDSSANCDATIYNEFAAAAYRFGHSLVDDEFKIGDSDVWKLTGHFMDPQQLFDGKTKPIEKAQDVLEGMSKQKGQQSDRFVTSALRNHLFGSGDRPDGLDLIALNIQRGRDHGLKDYTAYREMYGLSEPKTFNELSEVMDPRTMMALRKTYKSVEDIDLYTGLLCERKVADGMVGELGAHILAAQFHRLKDCDRFYYENRRQFGSFSRRQLKAIRDTSLAKVLCANSHKATELAADVFGVSDASSPKLNCRPGENKSLDLSAWQESRRARERAARRKVSSPSAGRRADVRIPLRCF